MLTAISLKLSAKPPGLSHGSSVTSNLLCELPAQEGRRLAEVALHRADRYLEKLGDLFDRVAAEEAEFHDLALPGMEAGQLFERVVQCQQVEALLGEVVEHLVQRPPF